MGATPFARGLNQAPGQRKGSCPFLSHVPPCLLNRSGPPGANSWTQSLSKALITGQAVGFPPSARWKKSLSLLRGEISGWQRCRCTHKVTLRFGRSLSNMHAERLSTRNSRYLIEVRSSPRHRCAVWAIAPHIAEDNPPKVKRRQGVDPAAPSSRPGDGHTAADTDLRWRLQSTIWLGPLPPPGEMAAPCLPSTHSRGQKPRALVFSAVQVPGRQRL